jgi:hypothetical protein
LSRSDERTTLDSVTGNRLYTHDNLLSARESHAWSTVATVGHVEGDGFDSRGIGRSLQMVANWTSIPSDLPSPARALLIQVNGANNDGGTMSCQLYKVFGDVAERLIAPDCKSGP